MKVKNAIIKSRLTEQHPINLATRGGGGFCQIHKGSAQCYINYQTNIGIIPTDWIVFGRKKRRYLSTIIPKLQISCTRAAD